MARSGETSTTDHQGDTAAHGDKTMRGGARRNFKIPPVIDHRAGSFLADRLRLLLALFMPLHWRRFLLITLLVVTGVSAFVLGGGPHSIFMRANPTGQDTQPKKAEGPERTEVPAILEAEPNNAPDEPSLQAQLKTMEEELRYTERKLAAALGQLRDTDTGTNTDQEGRRAALVLALGTGLPYQVHLQNLDPDWLGPEDMALLRRYGGQGFYDAGHLARRLSALLDGDPHSDQTSPQTPPQTLLPALDWLTRNAGALVEVRPQSLAQVADAQHDILKALMAGRPDAALRLVDEMLVGTPDTPSALRAWRNDLALWRTMAPVMARVRATYASAATREPE